MTSPWPRLPADEWMDTVETLHLWTQVVGKIRLAYGPWLNHSWGVTLYVTPRGLTTGNVPYQAGSFELRFDLLEHSLVMETDRGEREVVELQGQTVAGFYEAVLERFARLGRPVDIHPLPSEIADAVPFPEDTQHGPYEPAHAELIHRAWLDSERVMTAFRAEFGGKASPVHLYWGGFDLAVYRFSGREAPPHPGGAPNFPLDVAQEAYSRETSAAGFWLGSREMPVPTYFAYTYPAPDGIADAPVEPEAAGWSAEMGYHALPYEAVRSADDPDATLGAFLRSTYAAGAELGDWDRGSLELAPPMGADWWRSRSRR